MANHGSESRTLDANLKRRARKLATDSRVDPRTRSLIRYGLKIKDPYVEQVVKRCEAGEMRIDRIIFDSDEECLAPLVSLRRNRRDTAAARSGSHPGGKRLL